MRRNKQFRIEIALGYTQPASHGGFGEYPLMPSYTNELGIAMRDNPDLASEEPVFPENPTQLQVHIIGTARALEELGTYLIALARSGTTDPEPYGSLDDVRNVDGGTVRLLPRRVASPLEVAAWGPWYKDAICDR